MYNRCGQKILTAISCGLLIIFSLTNTWAQVEKNVNDSVQVSLPDSNSVLNPDTVNKSASRKKTNELKSKVIYSADDSIRFDVPGQKVFLYGNASIKYEEITLTSAFIEINWLERTLYAHGMPDSNGLDSGLPVFKENADEFKAKEMRYNFDTKKGKIIEVQTKEGDGIIRGGIVKKTNDNEYYIRGGAYTTCDAEHPHYYIASKKIKVIPNNKIVTGPANLIIEDIPTPFFIPFGFFPTKKGRKSGILFPTYGESPSRGFYLSKGGYYFGFSDYIDASVDGDVYSLGGWAARVNSRYINRYHYTGNLSLSYSINKSGEPELPNYLSTKDFFIQWSHSQDAKARPNSNFSANINAGSAGYYYNNITYNDNFITNTFNSSINYAKTFPNKPFNFSISANHTQNNLTRDVSISLPVAAFGVSTVYPFQKKTPSAKPAWYEKIGFSYQANFTNQVNTKDSLLFTSDTWDKFRNGVLHSIPVNTSFKVLKYFTLTPSFTYNERWYIKTSEPVYNAGDSTVVFDTINGFKSARDFAANAALNTRIYGLYQFRKGKIAAIRHVVNPTVGFGIRPDFSTSNWGYYKEVQSDYLGNRQKYSIFQDGIYGGPPSGKFSAITFGIDNNLEMKYRQVTDTAVNLKKLKLLESLSVNSAYNFAADSLKLSNISLSARTTLFDNVNLNYTSSFDPYIIDSLGQRRNKFEWNVNKRPARLTSANLSTTFTLNNSQKKTSTRGTEQEISEINAHPENYVDFNVPYNLSVSYNVSYSKPGPLKGIFFQTVNFTGDLSVSPKWKIVVQSGWDFQTHQRTYSSISVYRDLHCWEMHLTWIPEGVQQSYTFQINVKSSVLQDLKLTKKNDRYDTF
jgi:lipopolysaccharide assembly outer membrane protein LptD (OstA)